MKMYTSAIFAACCSLFSPLILAQTADGQTPAQESICDGLPGAQKGLCNAYCEAMDCNLGADASAPPKACDKLRGNLQKITGNENASFPCDCPEACVKLINNYVTNINATPTICQYYPSLNENGFNFVDYYAVTATNPNIEYNRIFISRNSAGEAACVAYDTIRQVPSVNINLRPDQVNVCQARMRQLVNSCNNTDPNPAP